MRIFKTLTLFLLVVLPVAGQADTTGVPGDSAWYFHADFDAMRNGKASQGLYNWLNREVFQELREELGVDFDREAQRLTAFSGADQGPIIVIEGDFSAETRDKIVAIAAMDGELETFKSGGKAYYAFEGNRNHDDDDDGETDDNIDIHIDSLEDEAYVSVDVKGKIIVTHTKAQMEDLLARNGRFQRQDGSRDALFVLQAERNLIQAGVNAEEFRDDGDGWDSNILKNTKKLAVVIADLGDKLGLEAQLLTTEPEMANSLASIIRGLISLQAFDDEMDPEVAAILQSTSVDVAGSTLKIALALAPEMVVSALED